MSGRGVVVAQLAQKVGFPFDESELSPELRRKVGELTDAWQTVIAFNDARRSRISGLEAHKRNDKDMMGLLIILGVLCLMAGLLTSSAVWVFGAISLSFAYLIYTKKKSINLEIRNLSNAKLSDSNLEPRFSTLSEEIFSELSAKDKARVSSPPLTRTVYRETVVKEVVTMPCSHCKGLMPNTSLYCPYCGAAKRA